MKHSMLVAFLLAAIVACIPARADPILVQAQLVRGTNLLYSATAVVSDTAVEFTPCNQLFFDFTSGGGVTFHPLNSGTFVAYDVVFTVVTPHWGFTGFSPLTPSNPKYWLDYDPLHKSVVFHHLAGIDSPSNVMKFQVQAQHMPEPGSFVLLGTGLLLAARMVRRRTR